MDSTILQTKLSGNTGIKHRKGLQQTARDRTGHLQVFYARLGL